TDDNSCTYDTNLIVAGQDLRVDLVGTNITCYDAGDGEGLARIVSGDEGHGYIFEFRKDSLTNLVSLTAINDTIIQNLSPGWYFVTAIEQGGSARSTFDSVEITQPDSISLDLTPTDIDCYGSFTGSITLIVSGGKPAYTYDWSNGESTQNIPNLSSGWYSVIVTDQNSCKKQDSTFVDQPANLDVNINILTHVNCHGENNGNLQAVITGGITPYNYEWNDPGTQTSQVASNLNAREYIVTITDDKGCMAYDTAEVTEPDPLSIFDVDTTNIACFNTLTGSIAVEMSGGTTPYSYSWNPGTHGDTSAIYNLLPQIYNLTVTDDNGCVNDSLSIDIKNPQSQLKVFEDSAANNICYGDSIGYIRVTAAGGWGNYEYTIDGNNWHSENIFDSLASDIYTVQVRDASGCTDDLGIEIDGPSDNIALIESLNGNDIVIIAYNGSGPYYFSLNGGAPQTSGNFSDLQNGTYYVEVTDANGCGPIRSKDFVIDIDALSETTNDLAGVIPNPTNGEFYLVFNSFISEAARIEVFSITGAKVYENSFEIFNDDEPVKIDIQDAPNGIYLIKVNNNLLKTKLIKQ
ncbi:MAG: T9SS type A sorting domain-containing protein, partial [Bacteroidales bacterium]|nr:T9SS type A sorting domain-containing protein [Bacteroidales bacterium]